MNEAGYTLAEVLAALLIIGLAVGGVGQGVHALGRLQATAARATGESRSLRAADEALQRLLAGRGPFRAQAETGFKGDARGFVFDCGGTASCSAHLVDSRAATRLEVRRADGESRSAALPGGRDARFVYLSLGGASNAWPPQSPQDGQVLNAVALVGSTPTGETPLGLTRLWIEQDHVCDFDPVAQACRAGSAG